MDLEILKDLLMWMLPGGFLGSLVTWLATRKERKVGVLSKLEESIDLLTSKYTEVLEENVQLKSDNAQLLANQHTLKLKIDELNRKIDKLTEQLKTTKNEKFNQGAHSPVNPVSRSHDRVMCGGKNNVVPVGGHRAGNLSEPAGKSKSGGVRQSAVQVSEPGAGDDGVESDVLGTDSGGSGGDDDPDAEPYRLA